MYTYKVIDLNSYVIRCDCKDCIRESKEDSLRHSLSRVNEYKALASPSLIALSSGDPILTAFQLSWELRNLAFAEPVSLCIPAISDNNILASLRIFFTLTVSFFFLLMFCAGMQNRVSWIEETMSTVRRWFVTSIQDLWGVSDYPESRSQETALRKRGTNDFSPFRISYNV